MNAHPARPRGLSDRLLTSGLMQAFGLDALLILAVVLIGVSVRRLAPDLIWGYAGALVLLGWWAIGKQTPPKRSGE